MKIGTVFKFEAPEGWSQLEGGARHVFHGPNSDELIVSASVIQGIGTTASLATVQERLFQNAGQSVKRAAMHPSLKVMQPFQKEVQIMSNLECWSLRAQTSGGDALFYQAVFRDPRGVLLVTLEAPNTPSSLIVFERVVKSVEVISEGEA